MMTRPERFRKGTHGFQARRFNLVRIKTVRFGVYEKESEDK